MTRRPWSSVQVSCVLRGPMICQLGVASLSGEDGGTTTGGTGARRSRTNTDVAAAEALPAGSVTTTENVYVPSGSALRSPVQGDVHATGPMTATPAELVTVQVALVPSSAVHRHTGLVTGD